MQNKLNFSPDVLGIYRLISPGCLKMEGQLCTSDKTGDNLFGCSIKKRCEKQWIEMFINQARIK
jgi:hypothetical protein